MEFTRQPFQYDVDTDFFFSGGARGDVVDAIKTALSQGVPLVTLTGTDGSGKTMICRMVEQHLGGEHQILFFEQGVESFDEVIEGISDQAGIAFDDKFTDRNQRLRRIVDKLKQEGRRLIVIIDGAESIFLATLERIRSMVDLANGEATTIQLLLSGQPLFLLNFKQLGIVTFQDIEERNYSLDPLDAETTHHYLNHCMEIAADGPQDFFSPRMADRIMDTARGNFRLINRLANRYVTTGSLMDPEVDGFDETETDEPLISVEDSGRINAPSRLGNVDLDFLKVPRLKYQWYVVAGGIIGIILAAFLLIGGNDEPTENVLETEKVPDLRLEEVEPDPIEIPVTVEKPQPKTIPGQERQIGERSGETAQVTPKKTQLPEIAERQPAAVDQGTEVSSPPPSEKQETVETAPRQENVEPDMGALSETVQVTEQAAAVEPMQHQAQIPADTGGLNEAERAALGVERAEPVVEQELVEEVTAEPENVGQERMVSHEDVETESAGQADPNAEERPVEPASGEERAEPAGEQKIVEEVTAEPENVGQERMVRHEDVETEVAGQAEPNAEERPDEPVVPIVALSDVELEIPVEQQGTASFDTVAEIQPTAAVGQTESTGPEAEAVAETVEVPASPQLTDDPEKLEEVIATDSIQIPELTVVTMKKPRTETAPTVVTLKDERKRPPKIEAPAPVPKPEPVAESAEQQPAAPKREEVKPVVPSAAPPVDSVALRKPAPVAAPPVQQARPAIKPQNSRAYYTERLAAGSRWLVGGGSGKYTVQLMVLQSDQAEKNLGDMLNETGYQSIKNQTYILKKAGQPQTVTLYFGEFNSQEEARQAQQQLPQFLQEMNPYTVAVNDAVNKARSNR